VGSTTSASSLSAMRVAKSDIRQKNALLGRSKVGPAAINANVHNVIRHLII
jgi:hypothetical protein